MNNVNIFDSAKPQSGEFFKFKNVGDSIQGTYVDVREGVDSFSNHQKIYVLQDADGKVWNLGFRDSSVIIHERMDTIRFGQIVGFKYDEERESKRNPGTKVKIIRIYADAKFVDQDWLDHQKALEANYAGNPKVTPYVAPAVKSDYDNMTAGPDKKEDVPFNAPSDATAVGGTPIVVEKPRNEAIDAIRNLAKTKGLTDDTMTEEAADAVIEKYTEFKLEEINLTKIIIKLTGFVNK